MKANIAKKVLLCTLSAALLAAPCAGVSAAGTGAGTKAASSGSSITAEVEEIVTANAWVGSDDNSGSGSSVTVAQVPVTSSVGGVKSSLPGVYLATSVRGTAITSGLTSIADNMDSKKSHLAQACIDDAAAAMGAVTGPAINVEIGKMASGKFSLLPADGAEITLKVGVPKSFAQSDKTFAVVAVRPGGVVSVLTDTDTDPNTVTFDTTAGQGVYALIKY